MDSFLLDSEQALNFDLGRVRFIPCSRTLSDHLAGNKEFRWSAGSRNFAPCNVIFQFPTDALATLEFGQKVPIFYSIPPQETEWQLTPLSPWFRRPRSKN